MYSTQTPLEVASVFKILDCCTEYLSINWLYNDSFLKMAENHFLHQLFKKIIFSFEMIVF